MIPKCEIFLFSACLCVVIAGTIQVKIGTTWTASFVGHNNGPYFNLTYTSICLTVLFIGAYLLVRYLLFPKVRRDTWYRPSLMVYFPVLLVIGALDAISNVLIAYSTLHGRVPIIFQPIIPLVGIGFSVLFTKIHIRSAANGKYSLWIALAIGLVIGLLTITGVLLLLPHVPGEYFFNPPSSIAWIVLAVLGVGCSMWHCVLQQRTLNYMLASRFEYEDSMLLIAEHADATRAAERYYFYLDYFFLLATTFAVKCVVLVALLWVNIIPWFGVSPVISTFAVDMSDTIRCYFGVMPDCQLNVWWLGLIFMLSTGFRYCSSLIVNQTSANCNALALNIIIPLAWGSWSYIWPEPGTAPLPLWSSWPSVALLIVALIIWRAREK